MNSSALAGRKLFSPKHHLWIRAACKNHTLQGKLMSLSSTGNQQSNKASTLLLDVGMTWRGLEDVGDINTITSITKYAKVNAGDDVVEIEWDGHVHSEADELYHAVWETFTKATTISSPISGIIRDINVVDRPSIHTVVDEETALFRVEVENGLYDNLYY